MQRFSREAGPEQLQQLPGHQHVTVLWAFPWAEVVPGVVSLPTQL